ncbi:hypothetical protein L861_06515 [Litchfieldella anticariensis FP35 = DSM 16096]|uniref:GST N-terminal domain-containing protein n=1 Tax=Litchfieldella anticariensis (strain DSM 16096 / CECT 5854 / CIP 108499 / LMG 22089 / FP35) TaxID=1121939 RepID=S2KEH2_LITA3|nr:glutathione S-transferase N-terminal domain-containing protein [Halomonas anticariensis]EPC00587.1 hypothetical protein L861_06515 [Halomonas anticariensis FP35 = DSM 16096]
MAYQLFYSPGACSLAVHIVLEELGQPFDLRLVSTADGSTKTAEYLAFNPKGRVPVLLIPGESQPLTELPAIVTYLARRHPKGGLLPNDPLAEARCHEWLAWLVGWVHGMGFGELWRPERFSADSTTHAAIRSNGETLIHDGFQRIEDLLTEQTHTQTLGYTLVDPFLLVLYRWGEKIGMPMGRPYPIWTARMRDVVARPAVARALDKEGVNVPEIAVGQ